MFTSVIPLSQQFSNAVASLNNSMCPIIPMSICPEGLIFSNKQASPTMLLQWFSKNQRSEKEERIISDLVAVQRLRKEVILPGVITHQRILEKYLLNLPFEIPFIWRNYLNNIIRISESSILVEVGMGNCGEGAAYSIVNSLIKQIETGERETIQYIELIGETSEIGHAFVLYNAHTLPSYQHFLSNDDFINFFKEIRPANENHRVVSCDSWINFHGTASDWIFHFRASKDNYLADTNWTKMKVEDYTIPSFRKDRNELNPEIRNELKNLMLQILKGEIDYENLQENDKSAPKLGIKS